MGFFKRLVQFLLYSSGFNHPDELTSELSPIDHGGPVEVVDVYDPSSIDGSCNTPTNRQCWSQGFDIHTDYELQTPTGVVRKVGGIAFVHLIGVN